MGRARDRASADLNGQEFILDADADTSISADTDDQIDIKIAGADDFQFTANTFTAQSGSTIAAQALTATTITTSSTVDVQGNEIILDDDGDTSITADTDDEIHVKIGGADDFKFKANTLEVQTGSNIDMNGTELILDADADSSITADTDDQIDLKVGGTDTIVVKPDVVEIKGSHPDLKLMDTDDNNYGGLFYNNGSITLAADHDATGATGIIKFAIDGSVKMTIDAAGHVTMPLQPAFITHNNSNNNHTFSSADTYDQLAFNTEVIDKNSDFASSAFTAPVDGTYFVATNQLFNASSSGEIRHDLAIYVNSTLTLYKQEKGDN